MSNNIVSNTKPYFNPALTHVREDTKAIMAIVGAHTMRLKKERGLSYPQLSKAIGCSETMIYYICTNKREYCSIALLAAIPRFFGFTLLEWLQSPVSVEAAPFGVK